MRWLFIFFIFITTISYSQCKTFRLTNSGDTLNCIDTKDLKQGKWVLHFDELRGNPGYEEEGIFKNNLRIGKWKRFSLLGDLLAIENYKWGVRDSIQQYFVQNMLEHEESWHAMDPERKFDTVYVPDFYEAHKVEKKIVKIESPSVKHGVWKYYRPGSMSLLRTETYVFNELVMPQTESRNRETMDITPIKKDTTLIKKDTVAAKPKAVLDYEKKNAKKKTKYVDGSIKF